MRVLTKSIVFKFSRLLIPIGLFFFLLSHSGFAQDYWSALQNLEFDEAETHISGKENELDYKKFLWAMQLTVDGDIELAQKIMNELTFSSKDSAVADNAVIVLGELWFLQNRWDSFIATKPYVKEYEGNAFSLVKAFADVPEEKYVYSETEVKLPFKLSVSGCPIITVEVNGKKTRLWLDTGASMTALSSDLANELGIEKISYDTTSALTGTTKKVGVQPALIDSLRIEGIEIYNHPAVILASEDLEFKFAGITFLKIDGIIGYNALKNFDIEINYRRKRIRFREPVLNDKVERNLFWLGVPIVRLKTEDGIPLHFFIDTGASKTNLFEEIFRKVRFENVKEKQVLIGSAGGIERLNSKKVPGLTLLLKEDTLNILNPVTVLSPIQPFVKLHGILGADAFAGKILHLNHANGVIEINPAE